MISRLLSTLGFILLFLLQCTHFTYADETLSSKSSRSITLYQWPLSLPGATPKPLGKVEYDTRTRKGVYIPSDSTAEVAGPVRIGVFSSEPKEEWFGTVVDGSVLSPSSSPHITLRIDHTGKVWHVEYTSAASSISSPSSSPDSPSTVSQVTLLPVERGAAPHLNRPVVVNADGKVPVPVEEKSFLQKYWWLILAGVLLAVGGGGGGGGEGS